MITHTAQPAASKHCRNLQLLYVTLDVVCDCGPGAKLQRLKAVLSEQMRVKRDEGLARRYELFGEKYSSENARRLEEDDVEKTREEEAELTDQTDTDDESDEESELDVEERAVLESQRQVKMISYGVIYVCDMPETRLLPVQQFWIAVFVLLPCYQLTMCLQCFDAVGWATGRASGL